MKQNASSSASSKTPSSPQTKKRNTLAASSSPPSSPTRRTPPARNATSSSSPSSYVRYPSAQKLRNSLQYLKRTLRSSSVLEEEPPPPTPPTPPTHHHHQQQHHYHRQNDDNSFYTHTQSYSLSSSDSEEEDDEHHDPILRAKKYSTQLDLAGEILITKLFDFLTALPPPPPSSTTTKNPLQEVSYISPEEERKRRGLTLPVGAIMWLESKIYPRGGMVTSVGEYKRCKKKTMPPPPPMQISTTNSFYQEEKEESEEESELKSRLKLLQYLLPRATHLRVTKEKWPNSKLVKKMMAVKQKKSGGSGGGGSVMSGASSVFSGASSLTSRKRKKKKKKKKTTTTTTSRQNKSWVASGNNSIITSSSPQQRCQKRSYSVDHLDDDDDDDISYTSAAATGAASITSSSTQQIFDVSSPPPSTDDASFYSDISSLNNGGGIEAFRPNSIQYAMYVTQVTLFLQYWESLSCYPVVNLKKVFPNCSVLVLDGIPPEFLGGDGGLNGLRQNLKLVRMERGCVYNLQTFLFGDGEEEESGEDGKKGPLLTLNAEGTDITETRAKSPRKEAMVVEEDEQSYDFDRVTLNNDDDWGYKSPSATIIHPTLSEQQQEEDGQEKKKKDMITHNGAKHANDEKEQENAREYESGSSMRTYPALTHLKLNHCGIGELSNLRPRRRKKKKNSQSLLKEEDDDTGEKSKKHRLRSGQRLSLLEDGRALSLDENNVQNGDYDNDEKKHSPADQTEVSSSSKQKKQRQEPPPPPLSRCPKLVSISLAHNEIVHAKTALAGLSSLPCLSTVDLSYNRLSSMDGAFLMLGNIKNLILSNNRIKTAQGLDRLYSLERLSLDYNDIEFLPDIAGLAKLPELMYLDIKGNPLEKEDELNCRIQILNLFRETRYANLPKDATFRQLLQLLPILDGEAANMKELLALKDLTFVQNVDITPSETSSILDSNGHGNVDATNTDGVSKSVQEDGGFGSVDPALLPGGDRFEQPLPTLEPGHEMSATSSFPSAVSTMKNRRRAVKSRKSKLMHIRDSGKNEIKGAGVKGKLDRENRTKKGGGGSGSGAKRRKRTRKARDSFCTIGSSEFISNEPRNPSNGSFGLNWNKKAFSIAADAVAVVSAPMKDAPAELDHSNNEKDDAVTLRSRSSSTEFGSKRNLFDWLDNDSEKEENAPSTPKTKHKSCITTRNSPIRRAGSQLDLLMDQLRNVLPVDASMDLEINESYMLAGKTCEQPDLPFPFNSPLWKEESREFGVEDSTTNPFSTSDDMSTSGLKKIKNVKKIIENVFAVKHKAPATPAAHDNSSVNDTKSVASTLKPSSAGKNDGVSKLEESNFADEDWGEDDVLGKNSLDSGTDYLQLVRDHFTRDQHNAGYNGPPLYANLPVTSNLGLYYQNYVFPDNSNEDDSLYHENEDSGPCNKLPRIKISDFDLDLMISCLTEKMDIVDPNMSILSEKVMDVFRVDTIPCGIRAASRLPPNRRPLRGFHGEIIQVDLKELKMTECRQIILCMSDSALYLIPDSKSSDIRQGDKRKHRPFPSRIPHDATFHEAFWPHAVARHPLEFLERITIGFGFQRLILHFSVPADIAQNNSVCEIDDGMSVVTSTFYEYTYVLLLCNKLRTISVLKKLQSNMKEVKSAFSPGNDESVTFDNDDKVVLDALGNAVAPASVGVILHYQILRQRWKHGEREAVRRVCVVTDTNIYLLNENYVGDGTTKSKKRRSVPGQVIFEVVDSASLDLISEVQAADEDPRSITIVIKSQSRLKRPHKWRLICYDGEGAERLVDDVRKATAMDH